MMDIAASTSQRSAGTNRADGRRYHTAQLAAADTMKRTVTISAARAAHRVKRALFTLTRRK
jgi:hypothetical protein